MLLFRIGVVWFAFAAAGCPPCGVKRGMGREGRRGRERRREGSRRKGDRGTIMRRNGFMQHNYMCAVAVERTRVVAPPPPPGSRK